MKINTGKIEGYENMTLEQKLAAIESYEVEEPDYSGYVTKETFDKTASELATAKKQLREKMTAEEAKAKEDADKMEDLQSKYDALLRESEISKNKSRFLTLGYDDALATETAEAMVNGDTDKVFTNHKKHLDSVEKKIREDVLKDTPKPTGGSGKSTMTKEQFRGMSAHERYEFSVSHPDEYKELYGGN